MLPSGSEATSPPSGDEGVAASDAAVAAEASGVLESGPKSEVGDTSPPDTPEGGNDSKPPPVPEHTPVPHSGSPTK